MRRNWLSGFASLRHNSPQRVSNRKSANALAILPKQVLRDILDTVNACNESGQPFDDLEVVLLGQFSKSKWQFYFELLHLLLDIQSLKPISLMGKL
jgi:hypothetical protein